MNGRCIRRYLSVFSGSRAQKRPILGVLAPVTRRSSPSRALAALLAAALLALAAGPAVAAVGDALADDARSHCERMGHTMPPEAPDDAPAGVAACCVSAPEAPSSAVVPAPPASPDRPVVAAVEAPEPPVAVHREPAPPRDTGPPPGPRRHLALSVLLV